MYSSSKTIKTARPNKKAAKRQNTKQGDAAFAVKAAPTQCRQAAKQVVHGVQWRNLTGGGHGKKIKNTATRVEKRNSVTKHASGNTANVASILQSKNLQHNCQKNKESGAWRVVAVIVAGGE